MAFVMAHMDEAAFNTTFDYIKSTAINATLYFVPSPKDIIYFLPRLATRAGTFVIEEIPGAFHNVFEGALSGHTIADATADAQREIVMAASTGSAATAGAATGSAGAYVVQNDTPVWRFMQVFNLNNLSSLGGLFAYMTSKWFVSCFAVAMVLNRTTIYASARRNLRLNWQGRALLRLAPILVLLALSRTLLQTMRCQTSPAYSEMRWGNASKRTKLDFAESGGMLYGLSSSALFWESELDSCRAVDMIYVESGEFPAGSLRTLWPTFGVFCFAQFVETLSCALQGTTPATEIGMSLFEHSLAFAEAEAMVSTRIGLSSTRKESAMATTNISEPALILKSSYILSRFNVPAEVLLVELLSALNHLSSHVLGVFGLQAKYRLLNTGVWGLAFMASFLWGLLTLSRDSSSDTGSVSTGILRFPTVCVVGFIPHMIVLVGLLICGSIYVLALGISILFPPENFPRHATWWERLRQAHGNMQANIPLAGLSVNMREDFYTSLLRTGFTALTAASEAVFLNEGRRINVGYWTWLEEDRMQELSQSLRQSAQGRLKVNMALDGIAAGVALSQVDSGMGGDSQSETLQGGYAREKGTEALKGKAVRNMRRDSVGAHQRGTRYIFAFGYLSGIFWLLTGWAALIACKALESIGVRRRPAWLASLLEEPARIKIRAPIRRSTHQLDFWMMTESGNLRTPRTLDVDVAMETRRRMQLNEHTWGVEEEEKLDASLYTWFARGGWWGERDESGDYEALLEDDDTLSVISTSTAVTEDEWASQTSGQVTPTQSSYQLAEGRAASPADDLAFEPSQLARLLNPQDSEARDEARMLAAHLVSDRPLTRRRYQGSNASAKLQVLLSSRFRPPGFRPSSPTGRLTPEEEAELLEYLIVKYRDRKRTDAASSGTEWRDGADGMGEGGPQCVVCQSSPRTILAWPCRCLSLCEECRVSLAMNNFGSCVCCRQEVVAFSRLFVP